MRNRILRLGKIFTRIILITVLVMASGFLIVVIHWHFSPESYSSVKLNNGFKAGFGVGGFEWNTTELSEDPTGLFLNQLKPLMMYWLFFRAMVFSVILVLVFKKLISILNSIESLSTFYDSNISGFRSIGKYMAVASVFSFFNISHIDDWNIHFVIPWVPLIICLWAYILAEVFSEGKTLLEDKNLIV